MRVTFAQIAIRFTIVHGHGAQSPRVILPDAHVVGDRRIPALRKHVNASKNFRLPLVSPRETPCSNCMTISNQFLNEWHVCGNKLVAFQVIEGNPSAILMIDWGHFPVYPIDEIRDKPY